MAKYRLKNIESKEDFEELSRISFNLRHYSKIYDQYNYRDTKINVRYWEGKMDKFLKENVELMPDEVISIENTEKWDYTNTLNLAIKRHG